MRIIQAIWILSLLVWGAAPVRAQSVAWRAKPATVVLDPSASKIATALVGVRVTGHGSAKVELVALKTNVGQLSKATSKGKATWVATFTPPNLRFPTVALMRADLKVNGKLVRRFLALPVSIKLQLPVVTKGAVEVSVSVENREFGPVTPKKKQVQISIPVIIPPGVGNYTISRITEKGVTSAQTKRFSLPTFPRMVAVGPKSAAAGTLMRVDVFHVGAKGKRYTYDVPLLIECTAGKIVKMRGRRSVQSFYIRLSGETGASRLKVFLRQENKVAVVHAFHVELARTRKLKLILSTIRLPMSSTKSVKVEVRVTDLFGNPAPTPTLSVTVNGRPLSVARLSPGLWRGWLYSPDRRQPGDRLRLLATAPRAQRASAEVALLGDLAVRLTMRLLQKSVMADGKRGVKVEIRGVDRRGMAPKDRTIKVESAHGHLEYLHRVRPGFFRGLFIPKRNTRGGVAVLSASTYRAQAVSARVRLIPIPQHMMLSVGLGVFSDVGRAVGVQAGIRYEYAVYRGPPSVHLGIGLLLGPHFGVGNVQDQDSFVGMSAGGVALARLRVVNRARFGLDVMLDVGVLGIYATYKRYNPPVVDDRQKGRAAFTTSLALEMGLRTLRRNEVFLQLQVRYLTAGYHDASTDNHITLMAGLGYRFAL